MKTIDQIINDLVDKGLNTIHPAIPIRDLKILKNISSMMVSDSYITEPQGNLVVKILKENLEYIDSNELDLANNLKFPSWKKSFRKVEKVRKVDIEEKEKGTCYIKIEISFDKEIKKAIALLSKNLIGDLFFGTPKIHYYALIEKNIVIVHDTLKPLKFTFSPEFLELYEKIKTIDCELFKNKFNFDNFCKDREGKMFYDELITLKDESSLIILDRGYQYQYKFDAYFTEEEKNKLEYKIANRELKKIYINTLTHSFNQILLALGNLKRNKILLVFDNYNQNEAIRDVHLLSKSLDQLNISPRIGIYFRFPNKGDGSVFNKLISDKAYNQYLDEKTDIVGISNGMLPKFMLKTKWYPDVVISFTNNFRNNRTDVYSNNCDCIIYYTNTKPLSVKCDEIL